MSQDPRTIMNDSPMSALQIIAVAITIGLNALDGFDILSIAFASPGIVGRLGHPAWRYWHSVVHGVIRHGCRRNNPWRACR